MQHNKFTYTPYKGRTIDRSKPVKVYRNLNKGGFTLSVLQGRHVVGHTKSIILNNVEFLVSAAGRERVRREGVKNVHAYVKGTLSKDFKTTSLMLTEDYKLARLSYNPYKNDGFADYNGDTYTKAHSCLINPNGIFIIDKI